MNLIFNALLLCCLIKNTVAYYIYGDLQNYHQRVGNLREHNSLSYSDDENSQIESEGYLRTYEKKDNYGHKRRKKTHLHNERYKKPRKKCSCKKCNTRYEHCEREFCDEMCSQHFDQYSFNPRTPEVIPLPYPVPVMIMTHGASDKNTSTTSTTTAKTLKKKTTRYERLLVLTTSVRSTYSTEMPKTLKPLRIRKIKSNHENYVDVPTNLYQKIISLKRRSVIPIAKKPYYRASKSPYKAIPLHEILPISEDFAEDLIKKLKDKMLYFFVFLECSM